MGYGRTQSHNLSTGDIKMGGQASNRAGTAVSNGLDGLSVHLAVVYCCLCR